MRRRFRWCMTLAAAMFSLAASAQSDFPSRQVRIITPFAPGGAIDVLTRTIAERLAVRLGQRPKLVARPF